VQNRVKSEVEGEGGEVAALGCGRTVTVRIAPSRATTNAPARAHIISNKIMCV